MYDVQTLDYNGQALRTTQINGGRWWAFCDIFKKVLGFVQYDRYLKKLNSDEKRKIGVCHPSGHGGVQMHFISDSGLCKILNIAGRPEAEDFKSWLEAKSETHFFKTQPLPREVLSSTAAIKSADDAARVRLKKDSSIAASLQKAQMLIRIAEHKAIPQREQLRLLNMAVEELTGAGLNIDKLLPTDAEKSAFDPEIMKLPEVIGVVSKKKSLKIANHTFTFYPIEHLADRMHMSAVDFNEFAEAHNLKTGHSGIWEKVMTPQGEAREFMYLYRAAEPYICKNTFGEQRTA